MVSPHFPQNVVDTIHAHFQGHATLADHTHVRRSVTPQDPALTIGTFVEEWTPDEESLEIGGTREPTLNRYRFQVQNMVVAVDEEVGREAFGINSKIVRTILYRDPVLAASLLALTETAVGHVEKVKRFGIVRQVFLSGQGGLNWMFLCQTHLWCETEQKPTP